MSKKYNESIGKLIDNTIVDNIVHKNVTWIWTAAFVIYGIWLTILSTLIAKRLYGIDGTWFCLKFSNCLDDQCNKQDNVNSNEEEPVNDTATIRTM